MPIDTDKLGNEFEDELMQLMDDFRKKGLPLDDMIGILEMRKMAAQEEGDE